MECPKLKHIQITGIGNHKEMHVITRYLEENPIKHLETLNLTFHFMKKKEDG